jgi:hypothetical protein
MTLQSVAACTCKVRANSKSWVLSTDCLLVFQDDCTLNYCYVPTYISLADLCNVSAQCVM